MTRALSLTVLFPAILAASTLLAGCPGTPGRAAQHGEVAPLTTATATARATPAPAPQRPAVAVDVAPVTAAAVQETLDLIGAIRSKFEASVRSEYSGKLSDVYITEWVTVKKGQALAKLDTRESETQVESARAAVAQAQADLMSAQAAATKAARAYQRVAKLKAEEIVSEQNLDDAEQARDTSAAQVQAAKARLMVAQEALRESQLKVTKSLLVAPMDGVVANRKANVGQFCDNMGQGDPLFRIVDNRVLDVVLTVPSTDLGRVRIGQEVQFTTDFLPGKVFTARVTHINPAVDPQTRAANINAEVQNASGELRDGLFVKGRLVVGRREAVVQVPRAALLPASQGAAGGAELFVVQGGLARKRTIQTGQELGETIEVKQGLKSGEQVVTRGAFMLQDGDPVKIAEAVSPSVLKDR
jgi:RND family efflux transporter MFP subunit